MDQVLVPLIVTLAMADPGNVRIGTTVTDRQGHAVHGLTAKDFELREDGVVQQIDAVEARRPEPRRLAILLDEFHIDAADAARVRDALARFVDAELRAGDTAVVLKPLDPLTSIGMTANRDALRLAIASFEGRKGNYEPRSMLEEETMGRAPALVEAGRSQVVLSGLRALAAKLGSTPGRSALLLVSEGFVPQPRRTSTSRGLPDVDIVERWANRYEVPIYAFDPRPTAGQPDAGAQTLATLVSETGGIVARGTDLDAGLRRAARELDGGYTLSFVSTHGEDGRYHPVQVTIRRGLGDARARAGYVSAPSEEMRRAMRALAANPLIPTRFLRRSPLIEVWSGVTRVTPAEGRVAVTWEPGKHFTRTAKSPASRVLVKATTADGRILYEGTLAARRESRGGVMSDRAEFNAPAGRVQLDMTILSAAGEKLDVDARDVEVPALKAAAVVVLPPIMIATQSAREFRAIAADADAAPDPSREFRRTDRLVIRVPAYAGTSPAPVTARLLNRVGQTMRDLEVMPDGASGVAQFDLPLAPLAPGDYFLLLSVKGPSGSVEQRVSFRVTG